MYVYTHRYVFTYLLFSNSVSVCVCLNVPLSLAEQRWLLRLRNKDGYVACGTRDLVKQYITNWF